MIYSRFYNIVQQWYFIPDILLILQSMDMEILINLVANPNKNSYFCITIESRYRAHSKMQKIICGEIGGLKEKNFIIIYISIRYKLTVSPRRITENKREIKQIPDNIRLSGISFFLQVAKNSRFKHIIGG